MSLDSDSSTVETRKVQVSGGSTYTVSLPKEWARSQDIDVGTKMYLYPSETGALVVRPSPRQSETSELTIDGDRLAESALGRTLTAAYAAGVDRIVVDGADGTLERDRRRRVVRTAETFVGVEPAAVEDDRVVLQSLLSTDDVSLTQTLLQARRISLSMFDDAVEAAIEGDETGARLVEERQSELDRLIRMIRRCHRRTLSDFSELDRLDVTRTTLDEYRRLAVHFDRIGRQARRIGGLVEARPGDPPESVRTALADLRSELRTVVRQLTDVVLEGDPVSQGEVAAALGRIGARLDDLDGEIADEESPAAVHAGRYADALREVRASATGLQELALERFAADGRAQEDSSDPE